jgi:uncharacterized protein
MKAKHPITYCLKNGSKDSEQYYRDIAMFSDEVMQVYEEQAGDMVEEYRAFLIEKLPASKRLSRKEYLFEVLMMGVYIREYGGFAMGSNVPALILMRSLGKLRQKGGLWKRVADRLRGRWAMKMMMKGRNRRRFMFPAASNLKHLILWLDATAEFRPQAARIRGWHRFFRSLTEIECAIYLSVVTQLADWFAIVAGQTLDKYTSQVTPFLETVHRNYKNREDAISVNKRSVEYHLNMLGAVVMNEVFEKQFQNTTEKVLLVPPCMRKTIECKSVKGSKGDICQGCDEACLVNRLRQSGMQQNFEVVIMHHASKPPDWLSDPDKNKNTGIIGVACPTNLISGGWTIQALGVPAQCVVLDHCGCRHWHSEGMGTSLNRQELLRRINSEPQTVQLPAKASQSKLYERAGLVSC